MNLSSFTLGFGMGNLVQGMFLVLLIKMELKALVLLMFMSPIESVHAMVAQPRLHSDGTAFRPNLIKPAGVRKRVQVNPSLSSGLLGSALIK